MRRPRLSAASLIACLLLLISAATASAGSSFVSSLTNTVCHSNGGTHGHGYTQGRAYTRENGVSGTNYMKLLAVLQRKDGGTWHNVFTKSFKTNSFPDDAVDHYTVKSPEYDFLTQDAGDRMRIKFVYQWWDERSGADHRLHQTIRYGPSCVAG